MCCLACCKSARRPWGRGTPAARHGTTGAAFPCRRWASRFQSPELRGWVEGFSSLVKSGVLCGAWLSFLQHGQCKWQCSQATIGISQQRSKLVNILLLVQMEAELSLLAADALAARAAASAGGPPAILEELEKEEQGVAPSAPSSQRLLGRTLQPPASRWGC